jgi:hypothetical protein
MYHNVIARNAVPQIQRCAIIPHQTSDHRHQCHLASCVRCHQTIVTSAECRLVRGVAAAARSAARGRGPRDNNAKSNLTFDQPRVPCAECAITQTGGPTLHTGHCLLVVAGAWRSDARGFAGSRAGFAARSAARSLSYVLCPIIAGQTQI